MQASAPHGVRVQAFWGRREALSTFSTLSLYEKTPFLRLHIHKLSRVMRCCTYITSQAGLAGLLFLRGFDQAATCVCRVKDANTAFPIGNIILMQSNQKWRRFHFRQTTALLYFGSARNHTHRNHHRSLVGLARPPLFGTLMFGVAGKGIMHA